MLVLVCGGASSGKSEYAEKLMMKLAGSQGMTYLATMEDRTEAAKKRIESHVKRREGRGFELTECERNISCVSGSCRKNVLLECLPTLVSNEMFISEGEEFVFNSDVSDKIFGDILSINDVCDNLVIVNNDVFSDGNVYDEMTERYRQQLGDLSCRIAERADAVIYMTCGIAELIKGDLKC